MNKTDHPCPHCGERDWTFDPAGISCSKCAYMLERMPKVAKGKPEGFRSLAAMVEHERAEAAALAVDADQLVAWYVAQLAAEYAHLQKLIAAFEQRAEASGLEPSHPVSADAWQYMARVEYAGETVSLLEARGHLLVCPVHGVRGVDLGAVSPSALAARGLVTGDGALAWTRYCAKCQAPAIERRGRELAAMVADGPSEAAKSAAVGSVGAQGGTEGLRAVS